MHQSHSISNAIYYFISPPLSQEKLGWARRRYGPSFYYPWRTYPSLLESGHPSGVCLLDKWVHSELLLVAYSSIYDYGSESWDQIYGSRERIGGQAPPPPPTPLHLYTSHSTQLICKLQCFIASSTCSKTYQALLRSSKFLSKRSRQKDDNHGGVVYQFCGCGQKFCTRAYYCASPPFLKSWIHPCVLMYAETNLIS